VVEVRAADLAVARDLDLVDARRVNQECPLDADAVGGHAANGDVLVDATAAAPDYDTLEHLDTLAVTLDHLRVNANGIAGAELRNILELLRFDGANKLGNHNRAFLVYYWVGRKRPHIINA